MKVGLGEYSAPINIEKIKSPGAPWELHGVQGLILILQPAITDINM